MVRSLAGTKPLKPTLVMGVDGVGGDVGGIYEVVVVKVNPAALCTVSGLVRVTVAKRGLLGHTTYCWAPRYRAVLVRLVERQ